jgi:predicted nucleotidyltransferase
MISLMVMSKDLGISATQLVRIKAICTGLLSVKAAVVFGSRSLGNYREGSDLDICLIDHEMTFSELLSLQSQIENLNLPIHCDVIRFSTLQNEELREHIERVGVKL